MVEIAATQNHIATLSLPFLCLEVYADDGVHPSRAEALCALLKKAWPFFMYVADKENIYENLSLNLKGKIMEVELVWANNTTMQQLNQEYRKKDSPTDVLTFTLLADAADPDLWISLPVLQLGSMFVSVEYAENAIKDLPDTTLEQYLLERFIHGMLHLLGMHHDTMEKFEKVVAIQNRVRELTFQ